jgi:hypothetical protein
VLRLDALFAAAELGAGPPFFEGVQNIFHLLPPAFKSISGPSNTAFSEPETPLPASGTGARQAPYQPPDRGDRNDRYR